MQRDEYTKLVAQTAATLLSGTNLLFTAKNRKECDDHIRFAVINATSIVEKAIDRAKLFEGRSK